MKIVNTWRPLLTTRRPLAPLLTIGTTRRPLLTARNDSRPAGWGEREWVNSQWEVTVQRRERGTPSVAESEEGEGVMVSDGGAVGRGGGRGGEREEGERERERGETRDKRHAK